MKRFWLAAVAAMISAAGLRAAPGDIAVYFGSFDPIHEGHMAVIQGALPDLGVDGVLVIPTPPSRKKRPVASLKDRLGMVRAAAFRTKGLTPPGAGIAAILREGGPEWRAKIFGYLYNLLPPGALVQEIVGMDEFDATLRAGMIPPAQEPRMLVVVDRPGYKLDVDLLRSKEVAPGKILFLHPEVKDVKSSRIRAAIRAGEDVFGKIPHVVRKYIESRRLYR